MFKTFLITFFLVTSVCLRGDDLVIDPPKIWDAHCLPYTPVPAEICPPDEIVVDLRNPLYVDGVLSTQEGGILAAPSLRIQARSIYYTQKPDDDEISVYCEGDLIVEYNGWVLTGEAFCYDFCSKSGYLINGKTAAFPWFIGGDRVTLHPDGALSIEDGYLTTSEGIEEREVQITASCIILTPDQMVSARNFQFKVHNIPILWLPTFRINVKNIERPPIGIEFGWGGFTGSHLGLLYRFLSWRDLEAIARFDTFFGQGVGGGVDTIYKASHSCTELYTQNYLANDIALSNPIRRNRYRFRGTYYDQWLNGSLTARGQYDVVSDAQMAADYQNNDFGLKTAGTTQLSLIKKNPSWIADLFVNARPNSFQSVNQELPSFGLHWHPVELFYTGIIFENYFKASYLDYKFSDDVKNASDFSAGRIATYPRLYRPFCLGPFTATPEAGLIGIYYSDAPGRDAVGQLVGDLKFQLNTSFYRCTPRWKHVIEPYTYYRWLTTPRVPEDQHFLFTIRDGYHQLSLLRLGVQSSLFTKSLCGELLRPLWVDLWTNAFFDSSKVKKLIPKTYLNLEWQPTHRTLVGLDTAWNFQNNVLDFFNTRLDWTLNENFAWGLEYRQRSRYDWRKADFYNFMLEVTRSEFALENSALSDQRKTFLFHTFVRPTPNFTGKFSLRQGWNRKPRKVEEDTRKRHYLEYLIELTTVVFQHWQLTGTYEKRESDNRYSFSLKLDPGAPKPRCCPITYYN